MEVHINVNTILKCLSCIPILRNVIIDAPEPAPKIITSLRLIAKLIVLSICEIKFFGDMVNFSELLSDLFAKHVNLISDEINIVIANIMETNLLIISPSLKLNSYCK